MTVKTRVRAWTTITPWVALGAALSSPALASGEPGLDGRCATRAGVTVLVSPRQPLAGAPLRVLVVSERPRPGARLVGKGPDGVHALQVMERGGPPYWWLAEIASPAAGRHRFALVDAKGRTLACRRPRLRRRARPRKVEDHWPITRGWDRAMENLYSAWIEKLFDAPAGERPSWTPLHQVLRDPSRNLLYNHLGADEDGPAARGAVVAEPDCADLPYYVRAYFAWKLRLPMGYRHCDRGSSKRPTRCGELKTNVDQLKDTGKGAAAAFSFFLRRRVSYVHSASGRTAPDEEQSDLYPLRLSRRTLRPGAVYVDPYGHLLVISKWVTQTESNSGLLYAVDGHPDLSVGRKRFWRGAFMFKADITGGAGGFKAYRPLVLREGQVVALTNEEISKSPDYRDFSTGQYKLGLDGFYDHMDQVINPRPLSPTMAHRERLKALYELIQERIDSVKAGEEYMSKAGYKTVAMPGGPKIFETRGPWEDYSTPARDMRLLIAIEDVLRYPDKVVRYPKRFALAAGQAPAAARAAMLALAKQFTAAKTVQYTRSDGKLQTLTMADVIDRRKQLEVAYNPNDCVELRWGASGDELTTCKRRAPQEQQERMTRYRSWFATRTRPPIR